MPRRIFDYPDAFAPWNAIASFGSYLSAISAVYFFYVIFLALTNSKKTAANPWSSEQSTSYTLEWVLLSPPPFHTFAQTPVIRETPSK
jgi:heme/copper-type cytochrome/quinol oxidase subunit 1